MISHVHDVMLSQGSVFFSDGTVIYPTIKSESDCRQLQDDLQSLENGNPTGVWNLIQASAKLCR